MQKAVRTQADDLQEIYSEESATSFVGTVDLARQEDKAGADINQLIARYGGFAELNRVPIVDAVIDYTIDLQDALTAITDAKLAWQRLPNHLRGKFKNWQELLAAIDNGTLKDLEDKPPIADVVPLVKPES